MEKLESVQYSAALAITGAWRGASRKKLYLDLGWESLSLRRWSRRLTSLNKVINNLTPDYTRDPLPPLQQVQHSLNERDTNGQIRARTEKYKSSFYPHCLSEWNKLDPEIRLSPSAAILKTKILSIIRPPTLQNLCLGVMTREHVPSYSTQGWSQQLKFSQISTQLLRYNKPNLPN